MTTLVDNATDTTDGSADDHLPTHRPSRVIVQAVGPIVDGGRFPAKASVGEPVEVLADVFTDGHDHVAAALRSGPADSTERFETPMEHIGNDRFRATFTPDRVGTWEFDVIGWVDHFDTMREGIVTKYRAGQDVTVELAGLADLLDGMAKRADGEDAKRIDWLRGLCRSGTYDGALTDDAMPWLSWRTQARRPEASLPQPLTVFADRERARMSAWYELFPRSAGDPDRHGTLADVEQRLDRIAGAGFDVLYLPPIHPIGSVHRKGRNNTLDPEADDVGSPWAIGSPHGGHTAVHPELGTVDDVAHLASACADRGMDLALDLAFQCAPDHPWVLAHPEWFKHRADGTIQYAENPPKKYQDIFPIDFESDDWQELWRALRDVVRFWIDRGVKVFRVDNPHTKAFAFWEWLMSSMRRTHPDVIFLAEAFTRPRVMERLAKIGFHQSYTYFTWRNDPQHLRRYVTELTERTADFMRPNFWPNTPDILNAQLQQGGRPAFVVRGILAALLSANWGVYGPAFELQASRPVREGSEEYLDSEKYQLASWDIDREDSLEPLLGHLNRIRRAVPALGHDRTLRFHDTTNPSLLAFSKTDPTGASPPVLVVVAADPSVDAKGHVLVDWSQLGLDPSGPFEMRDHFGGATYRWEGDHDGPAAGYVELSPWGLAAHVFTVAGPTAERPFTPPVHRLGGLS